jgi:nitroimidazol reductase NimA-like FMN-containing flavoprotein (pyridoxamine 5'-phosphate oxidase superfamily)
MKSQASNGVVKKRPQVCETAWRSSVRHGQAEAVVTV